MSYYNCYRLKNKSCSLNNMTIDELRTNKIQIKDDGDINYCRNIAKSFLNSEDAELVLLKFYTACGHYAFTDGQHRTCVASKLLNLGANINLNAKCEEQNDVCLYCGRKNKVNEEEKNLSYFDKLFETKKYDHLKDSIKNFEIHNHLIKL
ncbi:hypothetical protein JY742_09780 [Clostridioides difficile]|nr:hypothetical protein [Clostridioides difficile]